MREQILREILFKIKARPDLKKKLKVALLIGTFAIFLTGGLLVWAAISAVSYVGTQLQTQNVKGAVESLQNNVKQIPALGSVNSLGCWQQAQNMLTVETWLSRPLAQNLNLLRSSCLQQPVPECKTVDCSKAEASRQGQWG